VIIIVNLRIPLAYTAEEDIGQRSISHGKQMTTKVIFVTVFFTRLHSEAAQCVFMWICLSVGHRPVLRRNV